VPDCLPDFGERWPARLVATAAENRLSFPRARKNIFDKIIPRAFDV